MLSCFLGCHCTGENLLPPLLFAAEKSALDVKWWRGWKWYLLHKGDVRWIKWRAKTSPNFSFSLLVNVGSSPGSSWVLGARGLGNKRPSAAAHCKYPMRAKRLRSESRSHRDLLQAVMLSGCCESSWNYQAAQNSSEKWPFRSKRPFVTGPLVQLFI